MDNEIKDIAYVYSMIFDLLVGVQNMSDADIKLVMRKRQSALKKMKEIIVGRYQRPNAEKLSTNILPVEVDVTDVVNIINGRTL